MSKLTFFIPVLVCLGALAAACGDDESTNPTASPTAVGTPAVAATATRSATPTQPGALPGDISLAIEAVKIADSTRLGALLITTQGPCVVNPSPGILRPPACPPGAQAGTSVPALVMGGCPDQITYIDSSITYRVTGIDAGADHDIGVVDLGTKPLRYAALFGSEKVVWLGFDDGGKLIGGGGGGDCPSDQLRPRLATAKWLVGPDWGN